MKNLTPKFHVLASGLSKEAVAAPDFRDLLENWSACCHRLVLVAPRGTDIPSTKRTRIQFVDTSAVTLGQVVAAGLAAIDVMTPTLCVTDNATAFNDDVFRLFPLAQERSLSRSWMATAHPRRFADFTTDLGAIDEGLLSFFCAPQSIWHHLALRETAAGVPFSQPVWSGWLGYWSSQHVQRGRYHDVTALNGCGRMENTEPAVTGDGRAHGPLTFNAPTLSYVKATAKKTT